MTRRTLIAGFVVLLVAALAAGAWLAQRRHAATPPLPAVGSAPQPTGPSDVPTFDVVRLNPDATAVIAGRARPGAAVQVLDGATVLGSVTADKRGDWALVIDTPLSPGGRQLTLKASDADGRVAMSDETVTLVVPEAKHDIAGRRTAETGGALAVATSRAGASRVLALPEKATGGGAVAIDAIDYDRDGAARVGGRAPSRARIQLYIDGVLVGHVEADADGRWQMALDQAIALGRHTVRADMVADSGKVAARAEVVFDRQPLPAGDGDGRAIVVLPGNNLWTLAHRIYGEGVRYTVIYEANHDQIRDPDLIYPGQIFMAPTGTTG